MSCRETAENKQILGKSQRNKITLKLHIFMYFNGQMVSKQSLYIIRRCHGLTQKDVIK